MRRCPDKLDWQAVVDGEATDPRLMAHLDSCASCREAYREIRGAADLAGAIFSGAALPPGFADAVINRARPFPAGPVAVLLFGLLLLSALLLEPGGLTWWLTVGVTRQFSLFIDALFGLIFLGQALSPPFWLAAALLLVVLELLIIHKLKAIEE